MIACPMCGQAVDALGLAGLIAKRSITGHPAAILRAVWAGRGRGVKAWQIFDEMYGDDPDGGPAFACQYRDMWSALRELDGLLADTGVAISYSGRSGSGNGLFRLVLREDI